MIEKGKPEALYADGVTVPSGAAIYKTAGTGPKDLNPTAPEGTPERYIDAGLLANGKLPSGVTITEAQAINALEQIRANLRSRGLKLSDVIAMRAFLAKPPGADKVDFAGWNRAYRQFFANTNLDTGATLLVPLGTGTPTQPIEHNPTRPTRSTLEVSLVVPGWLVEIEVDALVPSRK
ncbi:Rid family hydrolase [Nocardia sp. NPDC051787]|uniref:Rid family hydrolase n=1 Tax=Nocardia sp. NPDC051787 TaxID=3155415 RepID=UPI00343FED90